MQYVTPSMSLKGIVHPKLSVIYPHVVQNLCELFSYVELKKRRYFELFQWLRVHTMEVNES